MAIVTSARSVQKKKRLKKNAPDYILLSLILLIVAFGIVMVYSASFNFCNRRGWAPTHFAFRQLLFGALGIGTMLWITFKTDYHLFTNRNLVRMIYVISICLSLSVMVVGKDIKGAKRWIEIGSISFQPSEITKIAVVLMISSYIVRNRKHMRKLKYIATAWAIVIVPAGVVALENLSSAIVIMGIGTTIIFVSSTRIWYYILIAFVGASAMFGAYCLAMSTPQGQDPNIPIVNKILPAYRLNRIRTWRDPWIDPSNTGYQSIQALMAVGSGGLFGKGLGQSDQKKDFLPEPYNDIIFAVICEELGLVGAVVLLLGYAIILIRGMTIAMRAPDYFGALIATGISSMVVIQVIFNAAVNTNTMPTTGMQLPLVSYGGTALFVLLATLGILLNVSRYSNMQKVNA